MSLRLHNNFLRSWLLSNVQLVPELLLGGPWEFIQFDHKNKLWHAVPTGLLILGENNDPTVSYEDYKTLVNNSSSCYIAAAKLTRCAITNLRTIDAMYKKHQDLEILMAWLKQLPCESNTSRQAALSLAA